MSFNVCGVVFNFDVERITHNVSGLPHALNESHLIASKR